MPSDVDKCRRGLNFEFATKLTAAVDGGGKLVPRESLCVEVATGQVALGFL